MSTLETLRVNGTVDQQLLDSEIYLLERYDINKAISVLKQEIEKYPDNRILPVQLSILGLRLNRRDLLVMDPEALPSTKDTPPHFALAIVNILREIGCPIKAVEFGYEILRKHFTDINAHRTYLAAFVPPDSKLEIKKPEIAEVGTAVCYIEKGDSAPQWIIIENSADPDPRLLEFSPDHALCNELLGKKIGDEFILAASSLAPRVAQIVELLSKYVYRYQKCLTEWQIRFPDASDVQMVRVFGTKQDTGNEELDPTVILKALDKKYETVKDINSLYSSMPLTLHVAGKSFGTNAFEALHHFATQQNLRINCCNGSVGERQEAAAALSTSNMAILDLSAIATLFFLERLDILDKWAVDIIVSQGTLAELREMISAKSHWEPGDGVLAKTESGYSFIRRTGEQHQATISGLVELVERLEMRCKILPCPSLAALDPRKRDILINGFGRYGAESILLASARNAVLWTDDHVQAMLGRGEYGVLRVWTQIVIGSLAESGILPVDSYSELSARLIGLGYWFTSINPDVIKKSADLSDWKVDQFPFRQTLESLQDESIDLRIAVKLSAEFIRTLFMQDLLPETKSTILIRLLEILGKRNHGIQGIDAIRKVLPRIFGLNVIGLDLCAKTMDAWLASNKQRLLIL